jgi:Mrp family chromosome partitioning ATPase
MALAQAMHRTVLLADLDFRNPSVHRRFEIDIEYGLIDYLLDDVPVSEVLVNPGIERLVVLPAGRNAVPNSSELLASPKMIQLVEELKSRYPARLIVFDLPPILWSDDTLAFSPYVDATLLVVADGITTHDELKRAGEVLDGDTVIGTVLNRSKEVQPSYYYK